MKPYTYHPEDGDRPHFARPSFDESFSVKLFPNRAQAVAYLRKATGHFMQARDWAMIGKLWPAN